MAVARVARATMALRSFCGAGKAPSHEGRADGAAGDRAKLISTFESSSGERASDNMQLTMPLALLVALLVCSAHAQEAAAVGERQLLRRARRMRAPADTTAAGAEETGVEASTLPIDIETATIAGEENDPNGLGMSVTAAGSGAEFPDEQ